MSSGNGNSTRKTEKDIKRTVGIKYVFYYLYIRTIHSNKSDYFEVEVVSGLLHTSVNFRKVVKE